MSLHRIDQLVVRGGRVSVSGLPVPDGELVRVEITAASGPVRPGIAEVREILRGSNLQNDDPSEPMISLDSWRCSIDRFRHARLDLVD